MRGAHLHKEGVTHVYPKNWLKISNILGEIRRRMEIPVFDEKYPACKPEILQSNTNICFRLRLQNGPNYHTICKKAKENTFASKTFPSDASKCPKQAAELKTWCLTEKILGWILKIFQSNTNFSAWWLSMDWKSRHFEIFCYQPISYANSFNLSPFAQKYSKDWWSFQ